MIVFGLEGSPHALIDHVSAGLIVHILTEIHHIGTVAGIGIAAIPLAVVETSENTLLHSLVAPILVNILVVHAGIIGHITIGETFGIDS